ncbi:DUF2017 domain-containing protein [Kribbia dieselivorans]|uniref:DUF2017 domain-containing protein n=1 Tax=Kribbia dieselivorans TaxID=331526 RepID=UPI00083913FC|nr:DUF2017 domain-containing protein [Kribbia dieselivorans]
MARAFQRDGDGVRGELDADERALVSELLEQVLELVRPDDAGGPTHGPGDEFSAIVAGLGPGFGHPVAGAEQRSEAAGERGFGRDADEENRDPAIDRLFPAGHREDEQAASEFRRLTEPGLRARKAANIETALSVLATGSGELRLDHGQAVAFMVALTDVRLVIGERLGMRTDEDAEQVHALADVLPQTHPATFALTVYDFLTWLQEGLAEALLPR